MDRGNVMIPIDQIVKIPFTMKPSFEKYTQTKFHLDKMDKDILQERRKELDALGQNIWFETDTAKENDLVNKTTAALGITKKYNSIVDFGLDVEDDILIMHEGRLEACFVAFASGWNAGDKQGKTLSELHNPVADSERLRKASDNIMRAMTSDKCYHRYTWGISPLGTLSNHPLHNRPSYDTLDHLWLRVEHERTMAITEGKTALFLINVTTHPLTQIVKTYGALLKESINSMTENVLKYKNLHLTKELLNAVV